MNGIIDNFLVTLLILFTSMMGGFLFAKLAIRIARIYRILDVPGTAVHKKHQSETPLAGGIALVFVLITVYALFGQIFSLQSWSILLATLVIFGFGLYDDIHGLNATRKIVGQLLAAALLISLGIKINILHFGYGDWLDSASNIFITIFWLVGITNAFNLVDSADGLAIGSGIISSLFMIIGSIVALQLDLTYLAALIFGVFLALLFYNLPPAKLFLGDAGTQTTGFFLAALAILYNPRIQPQASSWFVPILFFAIPIFDTCLVFFSRIRRGLPFYKADLNHTYHRLIRLGLTPGRAIWLMDLVGILIGGLGLFALYQEPLIANLIFASIILGAIVIFFYLERAFERAPRQ